MIYNTETTIDGAIIHIDVYYDSFKENGEINTIINSVRCGNLDVKELLSSADIEKLKSDCENHYENYKFNEIESLMNKTWYGMDNS